MKAMLQQVWVVLLLLLSLMLSMAGCKRGEKAVEVKEWKLFSLENVTKWSPAEFVDGGEMELRAAEGERELLLKAGAPMTGAVWKDWQEAGMPLVDYAIEFEAMRVSGDDFFATVTFPVMKAEQCVSFVLGGWGGGRVGISSVDNMDAGENETGSNRMFKSGEWYRVKVEVRAGLIEVWLNDAPVVHLATEGRMLGVRTGMQPCMPFGFASYGTEGRVRNAVVRRLVGG